jgi:chemotaxis protein methyltransferase CheR
MLLPLSASVFEIFRGLIEEQLGLHHALADSEILRGKLSERAVDLGFDSLLDYYYFLKYDPSAAAEIVTLTDRLVVNETYFFREAEPLELVVDALLAPRVAAGERPRVWSAACSTGEEPLTLAMMLAARDLLGRVDLLATDVSERALAIARTGVYRGRSLRQPTLPPRALPWLTRLPDGGLSVSRQLIDSVSWRKLNLVDREAVRNIDPCDVILCRNVLIYFGEAASNRVVEDLTAALRPAGALFVGVSESLLRFGTVLDCEEQAGVFFYRKRQG